MSRTKYQLLSVTDPTPALEVNLQQVDSNSSELASAAAAVSSLTEISLNEVPQPVTNNEQQFIASLPPECDLPSYNEAVRLKKMEAYANELPPSYFDPANGAAGDLNRPALEAVNLRFFTENQPNGSEVQDMSQDIGNNCIFLSAFMIAFFFNWIGFFASICLLPNAAGKYGALSGFGLSMAKWVTIVRYQEWVANMNDFQQKLFFWLFTFLGFYLFFRGLINYMTLRYCPQTANEQQQQQPRRNRWFAIVE